MNTEKPISEMTLKNKIIRLVFGVVWCVTVRPLPRLVGHRYVNWVLRLFGAKLSKNAYIYSSAQIYMPCNLVMEGLSILGPRSICYNVDKIIIKDKVTVSQNAHLCTASHDISDPKEKLITAPIVLEERCWIAADAFVAMGVTIGQGAVVGARAAVFKDVEPWTVVGGNPAKFIKNRKLNLN